MYACINCGAETEELYRRYCPGVLKVLKCESCGHLADKYIEYDPVIILVDLILIKKQAYRHVLYNSTFASYWKLIIILWLAESFQLWSSCESSRESVNDRARTISQSQDSCNFYAYLLHTALTLASFFATVVLATEIRWRLVQGKPAKYCSTDLCKALVIGGCSKLLDLLGVIWRNEQPDQHFALVQLYCALCLLTGYSVVCGSGKEGSLTVLIIGILARYCVSKFALAALGVAASEAIRH